ncbi:FAD-dependent oxidoreductase [Jatrophihabitans cynanchi]|uniref:FAD-dependent oxidoreductase n=1 Tax=Jatrophihabitans cynanchi TaxID=2944128 RepID=A0ABY7K479_9ACTN|nr:FAD-dependent oxidoreductase [Jatrophihabitans sp. SB3-54]
MRNRIVNTTHSTALPEQRELRYLIERARGGVGMIGLFGSEGSANYTVGHGPAQRTPDWDQKPLPPLTDAGIAYYDDLIIPRLAKRASALAAEGARTFSQVYHLGAAPHALRTEPPVGPSAVPDPYDAFVPHPLSESEIGDLIAAFAHSIRRVRDAGVDAAEIHGAHGYLITQFLSPYFNRRTDQWGGERPNRVRLLIAIIEAAREYVGSYPIGVRLGVDGDGSGRGLSVEELAAIAALIAPHVAYISVSGGNYSGFGTGYELAYVSPWYREPAHNVAAAAAVRKAVDVPVIVTGRIADPSVAEGILADGSADMVGMVRALIADPDLPNKVRAGQPERVRMCLGLSECHHIGSHRTPMTCAVNAAAAREDELEPVAAARPKTVVVIGAGPAGMEAARVAALRGHTVYLADRARSIGGTPRLLANDANRRNLRDQAAFFEGELARLGVQLMLGNDVSAEEIVEFEPDAVVVATGGTALIPELPGLSAATAITATMALDGSVTLADRVVVVCGLDPDIAGATLAEFAADRGCEVELISEHLDFAKNAEDATRLTLFDRLVRKGVRVSNCHRLLSIGSGHVQLQHSLTGEIRVVPDAQALLACGLTPNDALARALEGRVPELYVVGDALAPRRIMHATLEGARVGREL